MIGKMKDWWGMRNWKKDEKDVCRLTGQKCDAYGDCRTCNVPIIYKDDIKEGRI